MQRLGLRAFWRWWVGELLPLIPEGPRNTLRRRRLRPILAFEPDAAVLWAPGVVNGTLAFAETARIPLAGDPAAIARSGRAAIAALPRATQGGSATEARVIVALPASGVLRKTITLPAAVEENLEQVLAYDLDRHTPFKPDEVYFDAVVIGRDPAKKEIRIDWAAALKTVVDQARRQAESWGAAVTGVTPESPTGAAALAGTTLNLLPEADRPDVSAWRRRDIWIPLVLVAAAALAATALPVWQKRGYAIALMQLTEQARVQADASSALREQLERLAGDYNFALQRKYAFPAGVQVVEDVTKLLPDDTWLTQLELKTTARGKDPRREILLRGESANAGRLISLLEESMLFGEAAPRSPTMKIQPGPGEIFDLGAQLKPLPPPQPVQVTEVSGGDAAPAPLPASPDPSAGEPAVAPQATPPQATPPQATPPQATPPQATPPQATPPQATPPAGAAPAVTPPETPASPQRSGSVPAAPATRPTP
jgi:general secretion pathway protein L